MQSGKLYIGPVEWVKKAKDFLDYRQAVKSGEVGLFLLEKGYRDAHLGIEAYVSEDETNLVVMSKFGKGKSSISIRVPEIKCVSCEDKCENESSQFESLVAVYDNIATGYRVAKGKINDISNKFSFSSGYSFLASTLLLGITHPLSLALAGATVFFNSGRLSVDLAMKKQLNIGKRALEDIGFEL